jgi:serine/threonine protein kinase/dienelactone hydrolase
MDESVKDGVSASKPAPNSRPATFNDDTIALMSLSNITRQDLSADGLLSTAPRIPFLGGEVPALGGIPLLSKLGQGGMGAVYFGVHPRLRMEVAVKVLPFQLASQQPALVQRFYREAQIAARVKSTHLVSVIDVNEEQGLFYLVMEYVDGVSAGGFVRQFRKSNPGLAGLDEVTALDICIAACEGLACAHANAVIHRDIKPDNILIPKERGSGKPLVHAAKVADLGLARCDDGDSSLTGVQSTMGTPGFMSPEQANDAKTAGREADVFSMGATLYSMLAGQPPFQGSTSLAAILAAIQQPHIPITKYRTDLSLQTQEVIDRCLCKEPAARYANAAELSSALLNCREALAGNVLPSKVLRQGPAAIAGTQATLIPAATVRPPSSSLIEHPQPALRPAAQPSARRGGMMGLVAVLVGIPVLVALGWFGFEAFHQPASARNGAGTTATDATPATPTTDPKTEKSAPPANTSTATATSTQATDVKPKISPDEIERQKVLAAEIARKASEHDTNRKLLQEKSNAAAETANAAAKKAEEDVDKFRAANEAELAARRERDRLTPLFASARDAEHDAKTQFDKRSEDVQTAETALHNAKGHGLAGMVAAEKNLKEARDAMRDAGMLHRRRENERDKLQTELQSAAQTLNAKRDDRIRAEAMAENSKAELQAAQRAAAESADKLKQFENGADAATNTTSGPYKLFDGPYKVDASSGVLHDAKRNKDLPMKVYYPTSGGPYPVIIFSHGWLASRDNYEVLGRYWAGHGYVVIHPTHDDSLAVNGKKEMLENFDPYADPKALENRFQDIALILDSLSWMEAQIPALKNRMDLKQVGVGGHSLGAYTAQVLGGATVHFTKEDGTKPAASFEDRRIDAVLLLSPQGHGEGGLTENSWKRFKKPLLLVSGTLDKGFKHQEATWRKDPFELSVPGDKYQVILEGAKHGLGGITAGSGVPQGKLTEMILGPEVPEQRDWVKMSSLAFWDEYLKNDATAKAWLNSNALKDLGNGKLSVDRR